MFFTLLFFLQNNDFAIIRFTNANKNQFMQDSFEEININFFQSQNQNLIKNKKWIIFADSNTIIAANYIRSLTSSFPQAKSVIGRVGCVPNAFLSHKRKTKTCQPYPILKSGFIVSHDLLSELSDVSVNTTEYQFGELLKSATFFDDFHFHFFDAFHSTRRDDFAASFWQHERINLSEKFTHAAGLKAQLMLSPKAEGKICIGSSTEFLGKKVRTNKQFSINFECENVTKIEYPPKVYTQNVTIGINCFK